MAATSAQARAAFAERQENRTARPVTAIEAHALFIRAATDAAAAGGHGSDEQRPMRCTIDTRPPPAMYPFHYPLSLYGPYGEATPRRQSSVPLNASVRGVNAQDPLGSSLNNNSVSSLAGGGQREASSSFYEFCAASMSPDVRKFASEWEALSRLEPSNLARMSTKIKALDSVAVAFGNHVQPVAAKIVEEMGEPSHRRSFHPLPSFDHVFVVGGLVYCIAQNHFLTWLYGSHEAAGRAASNELRAVRTLLGNPLFRAHPPLCATVTHMGTTVFVSAPLPVSSGNGNGHFKGLLNGGFNHQFIAVDPLGTFCSSQIAEYVPLARHASPDAGVSTWTPAGMKFFLGEDSSTVWTMDCAAFLPHAIVPFEEMSKSKNRDDGLGSRGLSRHPMEDEINARLSVLLRPEFLHNSCVVQVNPDAGSPWLPPSSLEHTAHSVHHIYTQSSWQVASELLSLEHAKTLPQNDIAQVFHRGGVNLRYMGRVYLDVDASGGAKNAELREAVKAKLAFEAASRTFKSILYKALASETTRNGNDFANVALGLFRQFLLCTPNALDFFWNKGPMEKVMTAKYGFYVCPVTPPPATSDQDNADSATLRDGALRIYRTLTSGKRRMERPPASLLWEDNGAGSVVLHEDGMKQLNIAGNDGLNVVFPLLGAGARQNSALFQVAMARCHVDIASDLRGKKLVVTFKPFTKPCTALIVSETIQAVYEHGPNDLSAELEKSNDDPQFCELVEPAARKELQSLTRIADSDPRASLPLLILAHSSIGRGNFQQGHTFLNRWLYLKRTSPIDCVVGYSLLEVGALFAKAQRPDKAETILVEGLGFVRSSSTGVNIASFVDVLVHVANSVTQMAWEGSNRPPADRLLRLLEYLHYAVYLAEQDKLANLWRPLRAIAGLRKRISESTACWQCGRPAALVITSDVDPNEKPPIDKDRDLASNNSKTLTAGSGIPHALLQRRGTNPLQRRRRDDNKKNDEEEVEVFVKRSIEKIDTLFIDLSLSTTSFAGGASSPQTPLAPPSSAASPASPDAAATAAAVATKTAPTRLAAQSLSRADQLDGSELPACVTLAEIQKPLFVLSRPNRYFCADCIAKRTAPAGAIVEKQPLTVDLIAVFSKLMKLLLSVNPIVRSADVAALGEALLELGVLQIDIDTVCVAVKELTLVFGPVTHAVIRANLHLADVTMLRSHVTTEYAGSTRDVNVLMRAEEVLRDVLTTLLCQPEDTRNDFQYEIATVVRKLQGIATIYSDFPVAKREHQALHHLADQLSAALGPSHPLVGSAYAQLKAYYTALSKKRADRFACTTALFSAGKYACLWLESRMASPDVALEVDSQLTDISDNIVKPLRAGTSGERQAAQELYSQVRRLVANSMYATDQTITSRLNEMGELFRSHLKILERTDAVRAQREEIAAAAVALRHAARRVKLHRKRTDQYGIHVVSEMLEIRNNILKKTNKILDPELQEDVKALCELYAKLTKTASGGNVPDSSEGSDDDKDIGGDVSGGSPGRSGGGGGNDHASPNAGGGDDGGEAGVTSPSKANAKAQTSIYACLGSAPVIVEAHTGPMSTTAPAGASRRRPHGGGTSSGTAKPAHSSSVRGSASWSGGGGFKPTPLTSAQQSYLESLSGSKQPETIENVAKLLPKIARALESKNYNPVREH
jgi:hypothetical protein